MSAKKTSGSAGPSGADAELWQRILCSRQFKDKPSELCDTIAKLARKLCSKPVNPSYLRAYTAGRLIPLDKKPGIRPIGIGEILRRIIGRAVTTLLKPELVNNTAPLQTCAGLEGGVEASIHALRRMYNDDNTEGILLIDASNAFNALNRKAALHNIQYTCPEFSNYLINLYRQESDLFIANSSEIIQSREGTTQGGPESMGFYACSTIPLLKNRSNTEDTVNPPLRNVWYADDAAGGGTLTQLRSWWSELQERGPLFGYFPEPTKTWLITKPEHVEKAKLLFPDVKVTVEGHKYLGSFIGSDSGKQKFVESKVDEWISDIQSLAKIGKTEPQMAYSAYVYGLSKK